MKTNSRTKGAVGEREVAKMFARWFPGCRRSVGQARIGYEQPDIIGGGIETEFFVEAKIIAQYRDHPKGRRGWWDKLMSDMVKHEKLVGDSFADPVLVFRLTGGVDERGKLLCKQWYVALVRSIVWNDLVEHEVSRIKDNVFVLKWEDFAEYLDSIYDVT